MSDTSSQSSLPQFTRPAGPAFSRLLTFTKVGVLAVSVAAAIPTARNLYYSYTEGIPFDQVAHRLTQYDLWMKNLDCRIDYRALLTGGGTRVDVGACRKSGDIAIKVSDDRGKATYEWIAYDNLQKPASQSAGLSGLLISSAVAGELSADVDAVHSDRPGRIQLSQAAMEVKCQARSGKDIVRIVQEGSKCFREVVSPFKATTSKREEVPCDTQCTPAG